MLAKESPMHIKKLRRVAHTQHPAAGVGCVHGLTSRESSKSGYSPQYTCVLLATFDLAAAQ